MCHLGPSMKSCHIYRVVPRRIVHCLMESRTSVRCSSMRLRVVSLVAMFRKFTRNNVALPEKLYHIKTPFTPRLVLLSVFSSTVFSSVHTSRINQFFSYECQIHYNN